MDTATTIAQIIAAPLDGQTIALPPVLNVVVHVLGGLFMALLAVATLVYVATLLNALRTREGRAMLVRGAVRLLRLALHGIVWFVAMLVGLAAGLGLIAVSLETVLRSRMNVVVGDTLLILSGIVAIVLLKCIDRALASRPTV